MGCKVSVNIEAKAKTPPKKNNNKKIIPPDASDESSYDYELTSPDNVLLDKKGLVVI